MDTRWHEMEREQMDGLLECDDGESVRCSDAESGSGCSDEMGGWSVRCR